MRTQRRSPTLPQFPYTPLAAAVALALAPQAVHAACTAGTTICVNDPGDSNPTGGGQFNAYGGQVDLRGAITACTGGVIRFDLTDVRYNPSGGAFVIKPSAPLPTLTCSVDGEGHSTDTASRVTLDGSSAGISDGLSSGIGVSVQGLAIQSFASGTGIQGNIAANDNIVINNSAGIRTSLDVTNNKVSGNGTGIQPLFSNMNVTGNNVFNNTIGIEVNDVSPTISGNTVGGSGGTRGNGTGIDIVFGSPTVSGNTISKNSIGISIDEDSGATIDSNLIGTDSSGSSLAGNQVGIVTQFAYGTSISGNTIAAPLTGTAIEIDADSRFVSISGNNINTNSSGNAMVGGGEGIVATCSSDLEINGNVITTNGRNAIDFGGMSASTAAISGNAIGTPSQFSSTQLGAIANGISLHDESCNLGLGAVAKAGAKLLPTTQTDGILIFGNTIVNASQNGIVLNQAFQTNISSENVITGSALYGVEILSGTGNVIVENFIYGNGVTLGGGAKNIDLGFPGAPRPNDAGDADSGPNNGQNYPANIVVRYFPLFDETEIDYTLDSTPGNYRIDFYENIPATTVPGGSPLSFANTFVTVPGGPFTFFTSGRHNSISLTASPLDVNSNAIETSEFSPVNNSTLVPTAVASPSVVNFGDVGINSSSAARTVTVRSSGTDNYFLYHFGDNFVGSDQLCYGGNPICYGGAFTCSTSCNNNTSYAPGASCSFTVSFSPSFIGSFSDTIQICNNGTNDPVSIQLMGNGVIPPPVQFDPSDFDFGTISVGHQSPPQTFTLTNPGTSTATLGAFSTTVDFLLSNNTCPSSVGPGGSCTVDVVFLPEAPGRIQGTLSVQANGGLIGLSAKSLGGKATSITGPSGGTASASLTGTGTVDAILNLPDTVDFGAYPVGGTPIGRTVTLHNTGNAPLNITSITVSGPFSLDNQCPTTLAPDQQCNLNLSFSQGDLGDHIGSLVVMTDAPGGSGSVLLTATTITSAEPRLEVNPTQIGFGSRMLGTSQGTQRVTIKNVGAADAVLLPFTFDGLDYTMTSTTCGVTLAPTSTCVAEIRFLPLGFGLRHEHFIVNSNAVNNPVTVDLAGTGCRPFSVTGGASSCSP